MPTEGWEGEIRNHDWGGFISAQSPPGASGCCSLEASIRAENDSDLSLRIDGLVSGDIVGYARLSAPNVFTDTNTFDGGIRLSKTTVTSDYQITHLDYEILVDASSGTVAITLPAAIGDGQIYRIKKIDSSPNAVTVVPQSGDLIDGDSGIFLNSQWDGCSVIDASFNYWDKVSSPSGLIPSNVALLDSPNVFTDLNTFTGVRIATQTVTTDTFLTPQDYEVLVDATSGSVTIYLPPSEGNGQTYHVKKIDASANIVTVQADGSDAIDDSTSLNFFDQWSDCTVIDASVGYWDNAGSDSFVPDPASVTSAQISALVQVASAAATSADNHANTVSARVVSVSSELNSLLQSVEHRLSTRIDTASGAGGGGSVTSQEVSVLVQIASAAATSADAHANTASAAATSADNHANTVSARVVSVSAELNSLLASGDAALSTRIDGLSSGTGSVTSQEVSALVQIASAAATSADAHANTVSGRVVSVSAELASLVQIASAAATSADGHAGIASAAATSADAHANTVSSRVASVSAELGSLIQIASAAATSADAHAAAASAAATSADAHANTVSGRVASVSAELGSLVQIASAAATSAINKAVSDNTSLSAVITASINTISARVVSVSAELVSLVQIASAAATSADGHANTVSGRAVSISAELNSLLTSAAAALSTRIDGVSAGGAAYWTNLTQVTGSDFTTSSTTLVDVTGLTFAAAANKTYEVEVMLYGQSGDSSGSRGAVAYSGTHTLNEVYCWYGPTTQTAASLGAQALGNQTGTSFWTGTGPQCMRMYSVLHTTGTGNITVQISKTTASSVTIFIGSIMKVKLLT